MSLPVRWETQKAQAAGSKGAGIKAVSSKLSKPNCASCVDFVPFVFQLLDSAIELPFRRTADEQFDPRPALRPANAVEKARLHGCGYPHAQLRHWCEHGDFQRRQRGAAAPAA